MARRKISKWTEQRLARLFVRYNGRYWLGRLPTYRTLLGGKNPESVNGECDRSRKTITIWPATHRSDAEIRATFLHEMAHAASKGDHGAEFWVEIERLLRKGAPISVAASEAPGLRILADVIPRRFPRARRAMERIERKRQRETLKIAGKHGLSIHDVTEAAIIARFAEAEGPWERTLEDVAKENGLFNIAGKPKNQWSHG